MYFSRKVPPSLYAPAKPWQVEAMLRQGKVPTAFERRMRVINTLSAVTLMKIEDDFLLPFDVMDLHHILDNLISQDAVLDQMDSDELSYALMTGNLRPLWAIAPKYPLLLKGFTSGWLNRFYNEPFDPLCVMLAMRCKTLLDLIDEEGHSYNLIRGLGWGFIDFGDIPGEEPGDPSDYYPPEIDNPIDFPDFPTPPTPEPGDPGYVPPAPEPGDPGYVPPGGGVDEYTEPMPGDSDYDPPVPGDPGYVPGPGEDGYTEPTDPAPGEDGGGPSGGAPGGVSVGVGDLGGAAGGGTGPPDVPPDPCVNTEDPEESVSFSFTTDQMRLEETQLFELIEYNPEFSPENYTWRLTEGGGTLSVPDSEPPQIIYGPEEFEHEEDADIAGYAVLYTAPATNPNCIMNPVIELWCGFRMVAHARLSITSGTAGNAYMVVVDRMCWANRCRETLKHYNCRGAYTGEFTRPCNNVWTVCESIADCDCCHEMGYIYDIRTEDQLEEGCCPAALL